MPKILSIIRSSNENVDGSDTQHLSLLIDERDFILNKLEIAETRYISSFRISTPEPSLLSNPPVPRQAPPPEDGDDLKRQISRPQALAGYRVS